jgi:secretion/DNA translocation related TadE-like protein
MSHERGSFSILVAVGSLMMMLLALAAADLGSMLVSRARAQTAADAAALAAVVQQAPVLDQGEEPEMAARDAAERNGATLISCECVVGTTEATVSVETVPRLVFLEGWFGRRVRATARAEVDADVMTYSDGG